MMTASRRNQLSVAQKEILLNILIEKAERAPWSLIKKYLIETTVSRNKETGDDCLIIRLKELPAHVSWPTRFLGLDLLYFPDPLPN